MTENNRMQSSKQRVYNKAEKYNTWKTKRIRKIMINLTKSGRLSWNETKKSCFRKNRVQFSKD